MTAQSRKRRIGILGGMGPAATVLLMSRIIAMTPARDDGDHVPLLVDNNTRVPSRIKAIIEKSGEDPGAVLVDMARRLADAGVAALAMPCNTAHHYAPLVAASVPIPFLNMVELAAVHVDGMRGSLRPRGPVRVGMLTSPAVRIAEIFERAFAARGLEPIYPEAMDRLLYCIKALKANNRDDAPRATLREIAAELRATGADVLLVACSEFSIIVDTIPRDIPVVDTIDVLAAAVIAFASGAARGDPVADEIMIAANAVDPRGDASIKEGRLRLREEI